MKYHPETQGELQSMSKIEWHQIVAGVFGGAVLAAAIMFTIFGFVIGTIDYDNGPLLLGLATLMGLIAGSVLGPIIAMIFRKRTVRAYGL
jgi:hypothetical protein